MVLPELARITRGAYREKPFTMPSLFVFGTEDISFPAHIIRKLFDDSSPFGSDARLTLIDGAGHFVIDKETDATTTAILDFLGSV